MFILRITFFMQKVLLKTDNHGPTGPCLAS
jgi:hypothetical protein